VSSRTYFTTGLGIIQEIKVYVLLISQSVMVELSKENVVYLAKKEARNQH